MVLYGNIYGFWYKSIFTPCANKFRIENSINYDSFIKEIKIYGKIDSYSDLKQRRLYREKTNLLLFKQIQINL